MAVPAYRNQVKLLLDVLPEVAKEKCFALHGGTAINLFVRDMPRLSVDIDLTYILIEDRDASMNKINEALARIKQNINTVIKDVSVIHKPEIGKLQISTKTASIKLEVNLTKRGIYSAPQNMVLCEKAQSEFEAFCVVPVVPVGQLYGGKICAALGRQHPRDLFDIKGLLENEGFTEETKKGFLLCLVGGERPMHEVLYPNYLDQKSALENQFKGMTSELFAYKDYEVTRENLVEIIQAELTNQDKDFLLGVKNLTPDWSLYNFQDFPSVQWKLKNLQKLKDTNPEKYWLQLEVLRKKLGR